MSGVSVIFDYFKEAFRLNKNNKNLYKPQIILIGIRALSFIILGIAIYRFIAQEGLQSRVEDFLQRADLILWIIISCLLFFLLNAVFGRIVEAGLFNMYKSCIVFGSTREGDFWEGTRKYFFKFLFGDILIVLAWIVCALPYLILGLVTLTIGFTIIPLIVGIFLAMWRVSLVMNDSGIIAAFKDSIRFAKRNFYPLALLQIINWSFTDPISSNSNFSGRFNHITDLVNKNSNDSSMTPKMPFNQDQNPFNYRDMPEKIPDIPNKQEISDAVIKAMKIGIGVLVPVVTIATAIGALVKMIFDIFFSIALFVAYNKDFKEKDIKQEEVVL